MIHADHETMAMLGALFIADSITQWWVKFKAKRRRELRKMGVRV